MSKRGNTYPLVFNILGQDLTDATEVILTLKPLNRPAIHFDREHMQLTSDGTDTTIAVKLTEEQSLGMDTVSYSVDVNWMLDGTRGGTHIVTKQIERTLYPQVIGGGDTTIDPSVAEPDPAELTSEEVRVVNAVSPHVTTERVTGGAVITITDIDGTHTATVYDGQQGETGATGAQGPAGKDGKDGENGTDGISPTISVTDITGGHRVSITGAGGTQTFDVMDGTDGTNGTDGISPTASVTQTETGATVTVTDAHGTTTAQLTNGADGQDGEPGVGVPSGGTTGQVLAKSSGTDFATEWVTPYTGTVVETVTGTTPSINAQSDHRYVCGEVSTLALTLPASGIVDVVFESGSTATVLTITPPSGVTSVKWANGFDPTSLEANTTYELNIEDGKLGVAGSWT